ncbi:MULTISPECIES: hypothetical protein [Microvirga]|jgi:hypothetical protein|uniref:hypothetical protein n=1 Tax=Microvirga TaxID=186650 RepID=UPI0021C9F219|nr:MULTISPECIES: hypothetical protein [unclassified Microvirga]
MPVLDAKALEIDPKGAAFLKSVLRPVPTPQAPPREASRIVKIRFYALRRSKELTAGSV